VSSLAPGVVFDCNVFIQALLNPTGPGDECVQAALDRRFRLVISPYILDELRQAPEKPTPAKLGLTGPKVERLVANLMMVTTPIEQAAHVFDHPIDPDDSHYVDLAVHAKTGLIVSRDRHLLGLQDPGKPWSAEFRKRYPILRIVAPEEMLRMLQKNS
jgi:putative PIN family toxin of toxin-antitoxin system